MSTPRLRARTCVVDAELARMTVIELPEHVAEQRVSSLAEFVRSLVPMRPQPVQAEGPVAVAETAPRA